jgi:hypothetical protein
MWIIPLAITMATPAAAAEPSSPLSDAVWRQLSERHGATCEAVAPLGEPAAVRDALIEVATQATMPPWAPVNAAKCVAQLAATDDVALAAATGWLGDAELGGLALAVVQQLSALPADRALPLATAAAERAATDARFGLYARPVLVGSVHPAVAAIGAALPTGLPGVP